MRTVATLVVCVQVCLAAVAADPAAKTPPLSPLFDGKSLAWWAGNVQAFRDQDGAIVGGQLDKPVPRNEYLCTTKGYRDFELRLKFRLRGETVNAGVQFRRERVPGTSEMIGCQADMGQHYWGCLYDERRHKLLAGPTKEEQEKLIRRDDWNDYVIGYSGLWIARELKAAGHGKLITIETDAARSGQARENFRRAGLDDVVDARVGDARRPVREIKEPVALLFIDCDYSNYLPCLAGIEDRLADGAVVVADNAGLGAAGMRDYLDHVRTRHRSKTEWFDIDLPRGKRDAMEVTTNEKKGH